MDAIGIRITKREILGALEDCYNDIVYLEHKLRVLNTRKLELEEELKAIEQLEEV